MCWALLAGGHSSAGVQKVALHRQHALCCEVPYALEGLLRRAPVLAFDLGPVASATPDVDNAVMIEIQAIRNGKPGNTDP